MAASTTLTTYARIVAKDQLTGPLRKMAAQVQSVNNSLRNVGKGAQRMGRDLGGGTTNLFAATAVAGTFLASQFKLEEQMNRSRAILDLTTDAFKPLRDEITRLGASYPLTMLDAARASVEFGTAGLDAATQIAIFEQAVKGAMASGESVAKVAGGVTDVIYGLGLPFDTAKEKMESFTKVNELLAAAAVSANQPYQGFLAGMQKTAPILRAVGVNAQEGAVLLGALANAGIKAEKAGTALRTIFVRPLAPTKKMLDTMAKYNINYGQFVKTNAEVAKLMRGENLAGYLQKVAGVKIDKSQFKGLTDIMNDPSIRGNIGAVTGKLSQAITEGMKPEDAKVVTDAIKEFASMGLQRLDVLKLMKFASEKQLGIDFWKEMFGLRHIEKGLALASQLASGQLTELREKLKEKLVVEFDPITGQRRGPVDRFMAIMLQGFPGAVRKLQSSMDRLATTAAQSGVLLDIASLLTKLTNSLISLGNANPNLLRFGTHALLIAGAMAPLGFAIMGITAAISPLVKAVGLLAVGIGAATGAVGKFAAGMLLLTKQRGRIIAVAGAVRLLRNALFFGPVVAGIAAVAANLREIGNFFSGIGSGFMKGFDDKIIEDSAGNVIGVTEGLSTKIEKMFAQLFGRKDGSGMKAFFEAGVKLGEAFASSLGVVVDTLTKVIALVQKATAAMTKAGQALGLISETPEQQKARKEDRAKAVRDWRQRAEDERNRLLGRSPLPVPDFKTMPWLTEPGNDNTPTPGRSGSNVIPMPMTSPPKTTLGQNAPKPMSREDIASGVRAGMSAAPPRQLQHKHDINVKVDGPAQVTSTKTTTKEVGAQAPAPRTSNGGRS